MCLAVGDITRTHVNMAAVNGYYIFELFDVTKYLIKVMYSGLARFYGMYVCFLL